ncbi:hypothetical protein BGZ98_003003, partial [Dissophora globulifera]
MFAKSSKFIFPSVVALIACMTVDANYWCYCDGVSYMPAYCCTEAGGQHTGGNCLITGWGTDGKWYDGDAKKF